MKMSKQTLLLSTTLFALAAVTSQPAFAQSPDDENEIIVTGSRIAKKDFISNSPVATVEAIQFERTGAINVENLLNTLPQTVPGLDRTSNNPGNGTATVDLRGLGANRTLVLVNGRRAMPNGQAGVVDINTIAPAMIQNVEVLTGGASSVYGADAVAGVVNFILKDDFEGVEANIGYSATQEGDADTINANVTLGANTSDGRGNATINVGWTDRGALFQGDRDFSETAFFDNIDNTGLEPGGSSGVPGTSIFAGGLGAFSDSFGVVFEPNGAARPFVTSGDVNDFYNYAPVNFIQLPQERFTISGSAHYEISDHFEIYGEGRFANNTVSSQLAPTPIFQTPSGGFSLDGNPFIDPATQQVLSDAIGSGVDTDGDGIDDTASALLRRRLVEVGPRFNSDSRNTFQIVSGVRGDLFDSGWDYDLSYSEGRTQSSTFQNGNVNRDRFNQALLLADADGDGNVDLDANGNPSCADTSSNGATVGCSPLNLFGEGNISPEAAAFLQTAASTTDETVQRVLQANFSGDLGGLQISDDPIGVALGAEYIENAFVFRPSQDVAASTIAGFNGAAALQGDYDVYSAYGEASIPVGYGITLDIAGRVSDFSTAGTHYNYKVGGDWTINDQFRIRGNYNTAVRAPNIGELFSPVNEGFPGGQDPCSAAYATQFGAIDTTAVSICQATGAPAGVIGTAALDTASGQVRALSGGNTGLNVEKADTFTIGAVLNPDFIEGLTMSVDYFDISIEDAIGAIGAQTIMNNCYITADTRGAGSPFCDAIVRRADGTILSVSTQSANLSALDNEGIDVAVQYAFDTSGLGIDAGDLTLNYLGTYTIANDFQVSADAPVLGCAGYFSGCGEPDPTYRHRVTAGLAKNEWNGQLTWQLIGSVRNGNEVDGEYTAPGNTVDEIGTKHYFNGSISRSFNDNLTLTLGANNLLNSGPPVIGDNDEQANTYPATYDVFGRTFFANAKVNF